MKDHPWKDTAVCPSHFFILLLDMRSRVFDGRLGASIMIGPLEKKNPYKPPLICWEWSELQSRLYKAFAYHIHGQYCPEDHQCMFIYLHGKAAPLGSTPRVSCRPTFQSITLHPSNPEPFWVKLGWMDGINQSINLLIWIPKYLRIFWLKFGIYFASILSLLSFFWPKVFDMAPINMD